MKKVVFLVISILALLTAILSIMLIGADILDIKESTMPMIELLLSAIGSVGLSILCFMLSKQNGKQKSDGIK